MKNYGFVRVAAAAPKVRVADCEFNTEEILNIIEQAEKQNVEVIVFPELCITAYSCGDLFFQRALLDKSKNSLNLICESLRSKSITAIVGIAVELDNRLFNVGVVISKGIIHGAVPKTYLPNYGEFSEQRWFTSSSELISTNFELCGQVVPIGTDLLFRTENHTFAIELCEDVWAPIPPSSYHSLHGAEIIFNLSASNELVSKHTYRKNLVCQQSARCFSGYVYASAGNGESTTDVVFSGNCLIAENNVLLSESERFSFDSQLIVSEIDVDKLRNIRLRNKTFASAHQSTLEDEVYRTIHIKNNIPPLDSLVRKLNPYPFLPSFDMMDERCSDIFSIQVGGLAKRMLHTGCQSVVVGVSGGLDSTLALLVVVSAFDKLNLARTNIYGITMPGFGTTNRTYSNAQELMRSLGISIKEISIKESVLQHFKDINHDENVHDVTYENSQARERTQILMDYANKVNGLVIGTGDLSELALGWCTYNGDHMSMYAVNSGVPKSLVKTLVRWISAISLGENSKDILIDILDTPISPELLPANLDGAISQVTEDHVGPYDLHDFYLYNMLGCGFDPAKIYFLAKHSFEGIYSDTIILKWLKVFYKRFFSQQFKRSCMPDGPKVGTINLSPRGDLKVPSDACAQLWLSQLDRLN